MILESLTHKLFVARREAVANTTFSDTLATAGDFAGKPSTAIDILEPEFLDPSISGDTNPSVFAKTKVNGIVFSFAGGDADDDAFTWKIFAWKNENGPAKLVADGTGILGSQTVVKYPHNDKTATNKFWADTIVVSNEYWVKEVESTGVGGNSINEVWFDMGGYRYFYVEIPTSVGAMSSYFGYF